MPSSQNQQVQPKEQSSEDILNDALLFLGGKPVVESEIISYGDLKLTVAPKLISRRTLIELGAGCSLPSLAACTISSPSNVPSLVVTSDYPDPIILGSLKSNVERNQALVSPTCKLHCRGYEWGQDVAELLDLLPNPSITGFDIVILSDLLHFDASHDALVKSLSLLLAKTVDARVYVAAGKYTLPKVVSSFLKKATDAGLRGASVSLSFRGIIAYGISLPCSVKPCPETSHSQC
ncbi:nicotinamide n-methyltransferase nnt1 [Lentinula edodes]|uniref:Nicotinamide n-methyltransferase nnt1 n=1 Tax=Lentinula edodes TaxID=5353 RepID=A0A1Q3EJL9_LENED|nr:nicotinamide n-methyltransferase nnt1 [Lentinula edodes]